MKPWSSPDRPTELAFIDIGIAGERDGIAVASALTEQHGTACIFLTAQADRARTARDAALGVIAKPYDPRDVLHAVDVVAAIGRVKSRPRYPGDWSCLSNPSDAQQLVGAARCLRLRSPASCGPAASLSRHSAGRLWSASSTSPRCCQKGRL